MTPAPVAAVKNTKSAAEGKVMLTDDELQQELQNISESIDKLSKSDAPLTKQEKRRKHFLLLKKETLLRIKQAKEKSDVNQELKINMDYGLLTSFGERHPLLLHLARIKFRGQIF